MIRQAIILAGGLGTRLRSAVPELPKCMAPVNGRPFLAFVIDHFSTQGVTDFIFALGYKHEAFSAFLESMPGISYQLSIEQEPLGTGGAIQLACAKATGAHVLVTNGDTFYAADLRKLAEAHEAGSAGCTIALKPMRHFDRYGAVELDNDDKVVQFREKQYLEQGLINAGLYALKVDGFLAEALPEKFSFEKDYLEKQCGQGKIAGQVQDAYFIDIGIPEDYERAQAELR
jgi:D-glycero-alpha-D-manno-heptose 1-phosphate guanylyltransferase